MTISSNEENNIMTVMPEGRLDTNTADEFCAYMEDKLTCETEKLIIDMAKVDFISSAGLRSLIRIKKILGEKPIVITNPAATVIEVLKLTGLLEMFNVEITLI